jgi:adenylate cyclase
MTTAKVSSEITGSLVPWPPRPIIITSIEQNIWHEFAQNIAYSLDRLQCPRLLDSTILLLHKLITNMVRIMHRQVFQQAIKDNLYINTTSEDGIFNELLKNELIAHGDRNIEKFCRNNNFQITLTFPDENDTLVSIHYPTCCDSAVSLDDKLAEAIGFVLIKQTANEIDTDYHIVKIVKSITKHYLTQPQSDLPRLLTPAAILDETQAIFSTLNYGIIVFSSAGNILAVSPSILSSLKLEIAPPSIQAFAKIIPPHFYNDVIWGLALESSDGIFENYRIRIRSGCDDDPSILFNISGYRHHDTTIHTLWQIVSLEQKTANTLAEGSILNEARIHNITRHYVPQLVEQKAREIVRLGGNELTNEECFLAVLFCDIVGFTTYVENNEKEESVIHTLNLVLGRISKVVRQYDGMIDKFMGDCVMVLFRDPYQAVLAALEMHKHSYDINSLRMRAGKDLLLLRIGIHWGKVIIGNVGFSGRLDWTTIGDVVNTAARLEKNCQPGAVLISQALYETIAHIDQPGVKYGKIFYLKLKGKRKQQAVRYVQASNQL